MVVQAVSRTEDSPEIQLSVIVPAFNEQDGIIRILQRILAIEKDLSAAGIAGLEIIVVDDGSDDKTALMVESVEGVRLIRHRRNRGYGAAIKTGFAKARGDLLAFLDADGTYPPESLVLLCEQALRDKVDIVVGSRRSGAQSRMPAVRRFGNLIWSGLLTMLSDDKVQDPASGMRVLWRSCLQRLYPLPNGLNFTPVMSTRALYETLKVVEVPIPYSERSGCSKLRVIQDGVRFLKTIVWTALQYNPARIMELAGFASISGSAAIGLAIIVTRLQGSTELRGGGVLAVYCSMILAVAGMGIFSLSILFNRLVALFYNRPIRQVNTIAKWIGLHPERHIGWISVFLVLTGASLAAASMALGLDRWESSRLWLWLCSSALFLLAGLQLILFRMLIRVLDVIHLRDERIVEDLAAADGVMTAIPTNTQAVVSGTSLR
jgi:glycosyltransferase involved in cell wall biosynthesis